MGAGGVLRHCLQSLGLVKGLQGKAGSWAGQCGSGPWEPEHRCVISWASTEDFI